ncbi:DUF3857 domain-containing protein [Dysgonomonas sp. 511]|uniref:DUF3857 domain-containing protein n=1 Tax=Dysgonomonas sp. 511 TaxID=2302930 RepID=UPI0013D51EB0|nr:DUF3857 domain-containing protein [Dysgonomonas sp. 511]NDV79463.1 DUF3857 domain-containing protein [Dysgonomonas sp. 511]
MKLVYFVIFFSIAFFFPAQSWSTPSDDFAKGAVAILDNYDAVFIQTDLNNATLKVTKKVTVLNAKGDHFADFYIYGDKFKELKSFSGTVKNVLGAVIKKIAKKDLTISSISEHMATDNYSISYDCKSPTYPYTVEYTYEEKWKNGILTYNRFLPMTGYDFAVRKANLRMELPADMNLRHHTNYDGFDIKDEVAGDKHIYNFSCENMKGIKGEEHTPPWRELFPCILIAPNNFCFDSQCGDMSNWKGYGLWVSKLLEGRDILHEATITKLQDMVKNAASDKEKAKILYEYLQANSRYVSIQLGIGGFQPIEAASVVKSGFGDCKGLSNVMKAMLKAVGIESNYCEISMKEKELHSNFANVSQTDHAILLVPLAGDSVWLECTSQTLPFGYVHPRIAGHDALVISKDGGKICRLPDYKDNENKTVIKLKIDLNEAAEAKGSVYMEEHLHNYRYVVGNLLSKDRQQILDYINHEIKFPKVKYDNINIVENRDPQPSCVLTADFAASDFVNQTGSRMFVPACPLNKNFYNTFSSANREHDIYFSIGFHASNSVEFILPESYKPESLPKAVEEETPYGRFVSTVSHEGNKITYTQTIDIFSGRHSKDEYSQIKDFFGKIVSANKQRIVLRKN